MNSLELIEVLQKLQEKNNGPIDLEVSIDLDDLFPNSKNFGYRAFGIVGEVQLSNNYGTLLVYDTTFNFKLKKKQLLTVN